MLKLLHKFLDLLYENSCLICKACSNKDIICKKCEDEFITREHNYTKSFNEIYVYSWGLYSGKLREAIIQLKIGKKELANFFCKKLISFINNKLNLSKNLLVIPVPSHKKRTKERGYCQSTLIARELASILGLTFSNNFVIRIKETSYMNSLSNIDERIKNIKGAFKIVGNAPQEKNILIIDDILTSGSTMCELARTIHEKYPELNLIGLTVASGDTYGL